MSETITQSTRSPDMRTSRLVVWKLMLVLGCCCAAVRGATQDAAWHDVPSADEAGEPVGVCGTPGSGSCCAPAGNGTPGCEDVDCCAAVCQALPACCTGEWDAACSAGAQLLCSGCCVGGGGRCDDGNPCTLDSCDAISGRCVFDAVAPGSACEGDGDRCTVEECNASGDCVVVLDVNETCRDPLPPCEGGEVCNPLSGICESLPDGPAGVVCEADGEPCTIDQCNGLGGCETVGMMICVSACPLCGSECDSQTGLCPCIEALESGPWGSDIWGLEGRLPYPDNGQGVAGLGVVITNDIEVILDVAVEVESLCVLQGGVLRRSDPMVSFGDSGNLTVAGPEGIYIENGEMLVAEDQIIDSSSGPVTIAQGGTYRADPAGPPGNSAALTAARMTVHEGPVPGSLQLRSQMSVQSLAEFVLDGTHADKKGSCTPPDLNVLDEAAMSVTGSFEIIQGATILYASSEPLQLGGDFMNHSIHPQWFDWPGTVDMSPPDGSSVVQLIEAAGQDHGACMLGFESNFSLGTLEIESGASVLVVDAFDNQQDGQSDCEVLYVDVLDVNSGAVFETAGCPVYYNQLINQGSIPGLGVDVLQIEPADFNHDCMVDASDLAQLLGAWGACPLPCPPSHPQDLVPNCSIDASDLATLLGRWGPVD